MFLVNHYAICPSIPKTIFIKHCRVEIMRSFACSFTEIVFSMYAAFSVRDSLLHICSNYFSISMQFFSPDGPSFFCVSTIHQVLVPSSRAQIQSLLLQHKWPITHMEQYYKEPPMKVLITPHRLKSRYYAPPSIVISLGSFSVTSIIEHYTS